MDLRLRSLLRHLWQLVPLLTSEVVLEAGARRVMWFWVSSTYEKYLLSIFEHKNRKLISQLLWWLKHSDPQWVHVDLSHSLKWPIKVEQGTVINLHAQTLVSKISCCWVVFWHQNWPKVLVIWLEQVVVTNLHQDSIFEETQLFWSILFISVFLVYFVFEPMSIQNSGYQLKVKLLAENLKLGDFAVHQVLQNVH